jgi:hypothetical protein
MSRLNVNNISTISGSGELLIDGSAMVGSGNFIVNGAATVNRDLTCTGLVSIGNGGKSISATRATCTTIPSQDYHVMNKQYADSVLMRTGNLAAFLVSLGDMSATTITLQRGFTYRVYVEQTYNIEILSSKLCNEGCNPAGAAPPYYVYINAYFGPVLFQGYSYMSAYSSGGGCPGTNGLMMNNGTVSAFASINLDKVSYDQSETVDVTVSCASGRNNGGYAFQSLSTKYYVYIS